MIDNMIPNVRSISVLGRLLWKLKLSDLNHSHLLVTRLLYILHTQPYGDINDPTERHRP